MKSKRVFLSQYNAGASLGLSITELWSELLKGHSGITPISRFNVDKIPHKNAASNSSLKTENPALELLEHVLKSINPGDLTPYIYWSGVKSDVPFIENPQNYDQPLLPGFYRDFIAETLNIPSRGSEINAACASSTMALGLAYEKITRGEENSVLVCAADAVTSFSHFGFSSLKALSESGVKPFDQSRSGLTLGDGAAALLLCSEETLTEEQKKNAIEICGWGAANDANHITGPARDGRGLQWAVKKAMEKANLSSRDISAICAHGTGTVYNDGMEIQANNALFPQMKLPLFSIKGAIGHTLGAAGAIEAAVSAEALLNKTVPPTTGCSNPEESHSVTVTDKTQDLKGETILSTNSGFGGINAAIILKRTSL